MIAAGLLTWAVIAVGAGLIIGRGIRIADERENYPPPVPHPPVTQAELDETWQHYDIDVLEQRVYDRLFADQIAAEGLS